MGRNWVFKYRLVDNDRWNERSSSRNIKWEEFDLDKDKYGTGTLFDLCPVEPEEYLNTSYDRDFVKQCVYDKAKQLTPDKLVKYFTMEKYDSDRFEYNEFKILCKMYRDMIEYDCDTILIKSYYG